MERDQGDAPDKAKRAHPDRIPVKKSAWFKASRPQSQPPRRMKCSWEGESEGSKWRLRGRDKAREEEGSWDGAETYRSLYRLVISNVYVSNRAPDMSALDPDRKGVNPGGGGRTVPKMAGVQFRRVEQTQTYQLPLFSFSKKAQERNVQSLTNLAVPESA